MNHFQHFTTLNKKENFEISGFLPQNYGLSEDTSLSFDEGTLDINWETQLDWRKTGIHSINILIKDFVGFLKYSDVGDSPIEIRIDNAYKAEVQSINDENSNDIDIFLHKAIIDLIEKTIIFYV